MIKISFNAKRIVGKVNKGTNVEKIKRKREEEKKK